MIKLLIRCLLTVFSWGKVCACFVVNQVKRCFWDKKVSSYKPKQEEKVNLDTSRTYNRDEKCLRKNVTKPLGVVSKYMRYNKRESLERWDGSGGAASFCEVAFEDEMRSGI